MASDTVYLDYQSAKPVDPRVVEAMLPYFTDRFGNLAGRFRDITDFIVPII